MSNSTPQHPEDELARASREEIMAALFANMVIQQTNMAMMLLGKVAHPETGKIVQDFDAAKMFIDQLEMLETKTKGNLSKQEEGLLKQALAALHMAFVEAVDGTAAPQPKQEKPAEHAAAPKPDAAQEASSTKPLASSTKPLASSTKPLETPADAAADDSRKRFSKKY